VFKPETVMGLAYDQQPVYRHVLWKYRQQHPGTKIGSPPSQGFAGYNSGVMLLDLSRMRTASYAGVVLNGTFVEVQTAKYSFKGHLGDQDWLTLVAADHRKLFRTGTPHGHMAHSSTTRVSHWTDLSAGCLPPGARAGADLLPCSWNRQLCEYWKAGYAEVWDDYHGCEPPIHLWHGNCNSPLDGL
jgi:xylosyl alpha-1,3-xylosyltransferase